MTTLGKIYGLKPMLVLMILVAGGNKSAGDDFSQGLTKTSLSLTSHMIPEKGYCQEGWTLGDHFCYKVFEGKKEKRTYLGAKQFCEDQNAELLSEDDVHGSDYMDKTFWVNEQKELFCQCYKPKIQGLIQIACTYQRAVVCKISLGPFQLCPNGVHTEDENLFLATLSLPFHFDFCIISPYGKPPIVLGLKHRSGNESHMSGTSLRTTVFVQPKTEGFPLRYFLRVGTESLQPEDLGLWKIKIGDYFEDHFSFSLRIQAGGPLQLCPNGVYTEDENLFLAPLFLPFHFDLCIISPYGKPPIVRGLMHRSGNESHISGTSLRISGAIPSKTAGYPLRYFVTVRTESLKPEDMGRWKMKIVDQYEENFNFTFRIQAEGRRPKCPLEVNVTGQTNSSITLTWLPGHDGGAQQHFIVFYSPKSSLDDRKWHSHEVVFPNNSLYVSSTIKDLPADTSFLFRVTGVNFFNAQTVNASVCEEDTLEARTSANPPQLDPQLDAIKPPQTSENAESNISMFHIIVGLSVLAGLIIIIAAVIIMVFRKRAATRRRHVVLDESINYPSQEAGRGCANAQSTSNARSETDQLGQDQGEGDEMFRKALTLTNNPVYLSLNVEAMEADHQPEHSPTYENDYVSMDQFDAVGGDEGATNKRPFLKTFALRSGSEADNE